MSARSVRRGSVRPWVLTYGAILVGVFAADVAVTEAIDGAATLSEERLVWIAAVLALVSLSMAAIGYVGSLRGGRATPTAHRQMARATAATAGLIGLGRVAFHSTRLVRHIRLERDEPLTTLSLALQLVVSTIAVGAVLTFAVHELLRARRTEITAGDDPPREPRHRPEVGRGI